jgi:hypothetical protein
LKDAAIGDVELCGLAVVAILVSLITTWVLELPKKVATVFILI